MEISAKPGTNKGRARSRKVLSYFVKALFVTGLLYFLVQKGFISVQATQLAFTRLNKLLPAVAVILLLSVMGAIRWQWLLRAQGIHLTWWRTIQLSYIGGFFNIALPGAISGDLVKAFYIGREVQGQRARAFGSILFDRVAGLSALAFVSAGALLVGFRSFEGTPVFTALRFLITLAAGVAFLFYVYLFLMKEKHDPLLYFFKALELRFPKLGSFARIYEGIRHYHDHRWVVIKVLLLSSAVHLAIGWACFLFAQALGDDLVSLLSCYVVVPLGLLVTAVPVMPAGVGTGHAAFLYLFQLVGCQRGADIFTLYALCSMLIGSIGGLIYVRFKASEPALSLPVSEE
ncbi:MAG: hypothetical protein A2X97_03835 [Bdellovibrionales bacterium GWA1_52_35]|nr:MAG: hypothetical protein A2X97_03835 [Bdellovibrionales bacterium GWA1_52_35]